MWGVIQPRLLIQRAINALGITQTEKNEYKKNQSRSSSSFLSLSLFYFSKMTSHLSIINSKGKQVNLLNDDKEDKKKRKYQCTECQKSFTTRFVTPNWNDDS